jgi:hypothetical protein
MSCETDGWGPGTTTAFAFLDTTGKVIQTGAHSTFVVPASAVGTRIQCEVAVTNSGGTELAETTPSIAVKATPRIRIGPIAAVSGVRGTAVTYHVTLHAPAGLFGKFGVCLTPPRPVGGRICSSRQNPGGVPGAFTFKLSFTIRHTAPIVTTHVAFNVVAGLATAKAKALLHIARS